jgi:hypothetical protein
MILALSLNHARRRARSQAGGLWAAAPRHHTNRD